MAIKVGFLLVSNSLRPIPSTRIAALNMFPFLRAAMFEPHIVFEPERDTENPDVSGVVQRVLGEGFHIVVFQKVRGPSVVELARQLSAAGIKTLYLVCDRVDTGMADATDATVVVTEYLRSLYPLALQSKVHVVHDGIEHPELHKTEWSNHAGSRGRPLHAVLVTSIELDCLPVLNSPPEWLEVNIVGAYAPAGQTWQRLRELRWRLAAKRGKQERLAYLRFLANRRIRCTAWSPLGVYDLMRQADIGIIPIDDTSRQSPGIDIPAWKIKSENRLTMKMSMGLPVVATAVPSYEPVVERGRNGFLARSQREWQEFLDALRDPVARQVIGARARESVLERYSMREQARRLIDVLHALTRESRFLSPTP